MIILVKKKGLCMPGMAWLPFQKFHTRLIRAKKFLDLLFKREQETP